MVHELWGIRLEVPTTMNVYHAGKHLAGDYDTITYKGFEILRTYEGNPAARFVDGLFIGPFDVSNGGEQHEVKDLAEAKVYIDSKD